MDSYTKDIMTVPELCEYLQLSLAKVREMLRQGQLPAVLIGRQWRIRKTAIDRWLAEQEEVQRVKSRGKHLLQDLDREAGTGHFAGNRLDQALAVTTPPPPKPPRQRRPIEKAGAGARKPPPAPAPERASGGARAKKGKGAGARPGKR